MNEYENTLRGNGEVGKKKEFDLFSTSPSSPVLLSFTTNYEWGALCPLNNFFTRTELLVEENGADKYGYPYLV
ncbi:MAG: hypothetical protein QG591_2619 [Planctomycetota bacterium]|nr:hypothetical protein [Planctomycetota bacterium]